MDKEYWQTKLIELLEAINEADKSSSGAREAVELDQSKVGRLSRMDALQAQAMNNAIQARRQQAAHRINSALERIESDEFGYCIKCGDEISKKRLELDPAVLNCINCL